MFEIYDVNKNGFIEQHEVIPIMIDTYKIMNKVFSPTPNDVRGYIEMMDTDENGKISMEELEVF